MKLGLIINPIAGMGGRVGLKGTDGKDTLKKAIDKGAKPIAQERAREALSSLKNLDVEWYTWGGKMGESLLREIEYSFEILGKPEKDVTSSKDTKNAVQAMLAYGVDLIVFVGGDGTAVDILEEVNQDIPILGVPSGVKMYSAVFTSTPMAASKLLRDFVKGNAPLSEREVMDIDEEAYRKGILDAELKGYAITPYESSLVLSEKQATFKPDEGLMKESIAERIVEEMKSGELYILGPGSTVKAITDILGLEKTLLGVDLICDKNLIFKDVDEQTILNNLLEENWILVSPLGGQGSVLGRGNQQISARVVKKVGAAKLVIVATPVKLQGLQNLAVDTGDYELDEELRGYHRVIVGRHETKLVKIN
jgi:predicted polyphosphate/ATP-dependent NAD kinase